jgi:hypothetical protein
MEPAKWLMFAKTVNKEIFLSHKSVKVAKSKIACSAKIKESAKNVS